MSFVIPGFKRTKTGDVYIYPRFVVSQNEDLMIRGGRFYAIWDEERSLWSTDEYRLREIVDDKLYRAKEELEKQGRVEGSIVVEPLTMFESGHWLKFKNYVRSLHDYYHDLDLRLTFLNTDVSKKDYVSKRLSYPLEPGPTDAFTELINTLYDPLERDKLIWAIGSVVAGDSKDIQKFIVLYGEPGGGKSTILNIIQKMFDGYYTTFDAKALTSSNNTFSTEVFNGNPLVSVQHDADLSAISDNSLLNSIISHEQMTFNVKYQSPYTSRSHSMLFVGTNKPVRITDAKSGIIRRLIDVRTSGRKISTGRYHVLLSQIDFELGAIANECLEKYRTMGRHYYSGYQPIEMMLQTDVFYNFVESIYFQLITNNGITLSQAYALFKTFTEDSGLEYKIPRHKFRDELKNYFREFHEVARVDGVQVRSFYSGFRKEKFVNTNETIHAEDSEEVFSSIDLSERHSLLDDFFKDRPAQYAMENELPSTKWVNVTTKLSDLNTNLLHYVKPEQNHIVIDIDLRDETGKKSLSLALKASARFPRTYMEISRGGNGIHLHYIYEGDITRLSSLFEFGIEIKKFTGEASLRRKLTKCNNIPISRINTGLPLKGERKVTYDKSIQLSERKIIELILRNLDKDIHPNTRPSIDFIKKILDDAYQSGSRYDVSHLKNRILNFAMGSTNQKQQCVNIVSQMKFKSEHQEREEKNDIVPFEDRLVFFDVEVFINLFLICWKYEGENEPIMEMINPTPAQVEELMMKRLVGFNNRRYDNHILYARSLGFSIEELFALSSRIVEGQQDALIREAYQISYTDVFDFASAKNKKSLKRWQIELGIDHQELGFDWSLPVPKEHWHIVAKYCKNDTFSTEVVFKHLEGDWAARLILSELSGLSPNHSTNAHSAKIIFGDDKSPQEKFVYTNLSTMFPGYSFDNGKSTYKGEVTGEGGYVYAEPGIYSDVALLDVASMHPSSIEALNLFGSKYTDRFRSLKLARIAIKHGDIETISSLLDGRLRKFVDSGVNLKDLSNALKTVLVSVYGLTSATYDNAFRDKRNKDNIVAKRGALFMVDLKHALIERGCKVIHIKTDSVKIANATKDDIDFVFEFGKRYGYDFEHEKTFSKMCLVNDAVYIAKDTKGQWDATGAEFAHPYLFKRLFTKEQIEFEDFVEIKNVSGAAAIFLDMNEALPDVSDYEKEIERRKKTKDENVSKKKKQNPLSDLTDAELSLIADSGHNYIFIGRISSFVPVKDGCGGGILLRKAEDRYSSITGTKGYRWMEAHILKGLPDWRDRLNLKYYETLVEEAMLHISEFGDVESFLD